MRQGDAERRRRVGLLGDCQFANIAVASIQVSYSKLLNEVPGFNGAACNDLGIGGAHVVLTRAAAGRRDVDGLHAVQAVLQRHAGDLLGDHHAARRADGSR